MRLSAVVFLGALSASTMVGAASAPRTTSALPIDATCVVLEAGNSIADSLTQQMQRELTHDMHAVMNIFNMSCLQSIINFGGLNFFGLSGFLDGLSGRLCNAVRDWLTATDGDPSHLTLEQALARASAHSGALIESEKRPKGVSQ